MPKNLQHKPLNLALTMIPGPGDNLILALIDRESGRPIDTYEIATSTIEEKTKDGARLATLVTVSVVAELLPPLSPLLAPAGTVPVTTVPAAA
ncbi:hypothetical protein J0H58_21950 [bacterium]|nr:hypothetical protein [bacterium]